jgi:hypothetical protein
MKTIHIFIGEFSYAMNWHAPYLRKKLNNSDEYNIVVTFPTYAMLYRSFVNEVHVLPREQWSKLGQLATIGEHVHGGDITPNYIIEYCKSIWPDGKIVLPPTPNPHADNPDGIYKHLTPDASIENDIKQFLKNYDKSNTIVLFPKYREKGGRPGQNWPKENWNALILSLIHNNYNVIIINIFDAIKSHGGTYQFDDIINDHVKIFNIDRNDPFALDKQAWMLKLTKCSIYGSSGAANLPFWVNTPVCAIMLKPFGQRLLFQWQRQLTNNHEKNKIMLIDNLELTPFKNIEQEILNYIQSL